MNAARKTGPRLLGQHLGRRSNRLIGGSCGR